MCILNLIWLLFFFSFARSFVHSYSQPSSHSFIHSLLIVDDYVVLWRCSVNDVIWSLNQCRYVSAREIENHTQAVIRFTWWLDEFERFPTMFDVVELLSLACRGHWCWCYYYYFCKWDDAMQTRVCLLSKSRASFPLSLSLSLFLSYSRLCFFKSLLTGCVIVTRTQIMDICDRASCNHLIHDDDNFQRREKE